MASLKIPKSLVWIGLVALLLLLMMTAYRLIGISLFAPDTRPVSSGRIIWLGLRFDLRYISLISLLVMLLGWIPGMHLFKSSMGKKLGILLYTLFGGIMLLLYGTDMACQVTFSQRIYPGVWTDLLGSTPAGQELRRNAPWAIILVVAGVGTWLFYTLVRLLHHIAGKAKSSGDQNVMRLFWQGLFLVLFVLAVYGRPGSTSLSVASAQNLKNAQAAQAALNPFEALRNKAPEKMKGPKP